MNLRRFLNGIRGGSPSWHQTSRSRLATTAAQDLCRTGRHYARSSDRLGRSLRDLVAFLGELHAKGIDLYLHQQGIDTTTPAGKAMFQMMGVFAEFERAMIVERVKAGLARARAAGKRLGRPTIPRRKEEAVRRLLVSGTGIVKTAKTALVLVSALRNASRPNSARKQHWRPS